MNHDASGKQVLAKSREGNQKKLCKAAAAGQDYTLTHSLTRSGVWEGQDYRTGHHQCSFQIDEECYAVVL
jgi:hypothetical protein